MRISLIGLIALFAAFAAAAEEYRGFYVSPFFYYGNPERKNELAAIPVFDYRFTENYKVGVHVESSIPYIPFLTGYFLFRYISACDNPNFLAVRPGSTNGEMFLNVKDNGFDLGLGLNVHLMWDGFIEIYAGGGVKYSLLNFTTDTNAPVTKKALSGIGGTIMAGVYVRTLYPFYLTASAGMDVQNYNDGTWPTRDANGALTSAIPAGAVNFTHREYFFTLGISMRLPLTNAPMTNWGDYPDPAVTNTRATNRSTNTGGRQSVW